MPVAAILDEKIFCCHGGMVLITSLCMALHDEVCQLKHGMCDFLGLSPDLQSMEQIRRIMRPTDVPDQGLFVTTTLMFCHCISLRIVMWFAVGWPR